jgi:molybdopterin-guanine dinucleotide biosynthesis protein MobB
MKRVHVVGCKNHGKTTLVTELVAELVSRGLKVGAIKHTSHSHELDRPGSDSHRLRAAGASPSTIVAGGLMAIFVPLAEGSDYTRDLEEAYADCDVVLVEGDMSRQGGVKIEVWRQAVGGACRAIGRDDIVAVVSDDEVDIDLPVWPRRDVAAVAERLLELVS